MCTSLIFSLIQGNIAMLLCIMNNGPSTKHTKYRVVWGDLFLFSVTCPTRPATTSLTSPQETRCEGAALHSRGHFFCASPRGSIGTYIWPHQCLAPGCFHDTCTTRKLWFIVTRNTPGRGYGISTIRTICRGSGEKSR